jgi:hypothetical protein
MELVVEFEELSWTVLMPLEDLKLLIVLPQNSPHRDSPTPLEHSME